MVLSCKSHSSSSKVAFQQLSPSSWVGLDSSQRPQENIQTTSGGFGQATGGRRFWSLPHYPKQPELLISQKG